MSSKSKSTKMIQKKKVKHVILSADTSAKKDFNKPKKDKPNSSEKSQQSRGVKRKFEDTNQDRGVKRKFEDTNQENNQLQGSEGKKKFKKRKLKAKQHGGTMDSSSEKTELKSDSSKANLQNTKSAQIAPTAPKVVPKNKMNVIVNKNWEALLKTLPKDPPKKKDVKREGKKKIWRKPPTKDGKVGQKVGEKITKGQPETSSESNKKVVRKEDIWFDDVDEHLIEGLEEPEESTDKTVEGETGTTEAENPLVKSYSFEGATKVVAMDCEMVGVGSEGRDSVLARVSIVNKFGHTLLDKYVKPKEKVTDYRTFVSGIRPSDLKNAEDFETVQKEVHKILKGRILVGHALHNDMKVLFLDHPRKMIRDTARYKPFRKLFDGKIPSLKKLSAKLLSVEVQSGEHSSVQDAQAAMRVYTMHRTEWEKLLKAQVKSKRPVSKKKAKGKGDEKGKSNIQKMDSLVESDS